MSIATIIAGVLVLGAIVTCLPRPSALKTCWLGYRAVCPFAPVSSGTLLIGAFVVWLLGNLG
jgi:hypothetical protein